MEITSKADAGLKAPFYESMVSDVIHQGYQLRSESQAPWETLMYYVGALEERVRALESEKGKTT